MTATRWILMGYRLPREPSTPRIALWRKLRALGVAQLLDGLVALPLDSRNREQLEWLADEVLEGGGESSLWIAEAMSAAQQRELVDRLTAAIATEYEALTDLARSLTSADELTRRRAVTRLRRELRRIEGRDYFPPPERQAARDAIESLSAATEASR